MAFSFTPDEKNLDPLKEFGRNITNLAAQNKLDPVIGRDDETRRIIRILSRKTKNNPVLVGEPGVGKTAIVEGLAMRIVAGDVPEGLRDKEIIEIDLGALIAGASFQGQFEKRLKDLLKKVEESDGQIMLFIDEVHLLVGTGKNNSGSMDAAQLLKPLLARGKLRMIGATTFDEYRQYIEKDAALERRMQKVQVNEPTEAEAITILRGIKEKYESYHGVKILDNALVQAVKLSTRYITERFLPDKAIDLVDEAAAAIQTEIHSKPEALEKNEQKLAMLKIEAAALNKENDEKSQQRLAEIKDQIKKMSEKVESLAKAWKEERASIKSVSELREKVELYRQQLQRYQQDGEYEKASILLYKEIPDLEKKIITLETKNKNREQALVKEVVSENEIADIVSKWMQIPVNKLLQDERQKYLTLQQRLGERVKGQDEALSLVSSAIMRAKADINDPQRPIGSFIFMGPTGVGKTEVARALSAQLFDSEKKLIRIDMSEYMEEHSISRLIGAPPGYVGYDEGGQLTEAVRQNPYSVVLFDEIEKAHPKVLDLLLQILDDGQVTDSHGKLINFKNTIIIMTSNIGSSEILEKKSEDKIRNSLFKYLRPEFINRIDEIVIFKNLSDTAMKEIVANELKKVAERLKDRPIYLSFSNEVVDLVAVESYDPIFGARPIKRYIKTKIETPLAQSIIKNEVKPNHHYEAVVKNNEIKFELKRLN